MAVQGKYLYWNSDLSDVYHIRNEVLYGELNVREEYEINEKDKLSTIAIVYSHENNKAVGTGRIIYDGENYIIDQILVLNEERKKYYGDFITRLLITKGFTSGASEIHLITTNESLDFFKKIGFIIDENKRVLYNNIWISMSIKQDNICKKCNNL